MPKTYTQLYEDNPAASLDGTEILAADKGVSTAGLTIQQIVDLSISSGIHFGAADNPPANPVEGMLWVQIP